MDFNMRDPGPAIFIDPFGTPLYLVLAKPRPI